MDSASKPSEMKIIVNEIFVSPRSDLFLPGPPPDAMAIQISQAEQDHHALLRRRSYELAVLRGHVRR